MTGTRRTLIRLLVAFIFIGTTAAFSQDSANTLERVRTLPLAPGEAWSRAINLVKASPAVVNTIDQRSLLLSFSMQLSEGDVRKYLLEGPEVERQPHMVHITIWVSAAGEGSRVFVRAAPGAAGFFSHSNGMIEREIFAAIMKGSAWRTAAAGAKPRRLAHPPSHAWRAIVDTLTSADRLVVNAADEQAGVAAFSLAIPSSAFSKYSPAATKTYYPGAASLSLWIRADGDSTVAETRVLLHYLGSLSPAALPSSGKLEEDLLAAVDQRARGETAEFSPGSDYKGNREFFTVLFRDPPLTAAEIERDAFRQELPVPQESAWTAVLRVLTQTSVIKKCDQAAGLLWIVAAHPSEAKARFSVHELALRLSPSQFGTTLSIAAPDAVDPPRELETERKVIAEKIGMELFLKERLKWLLTKREGSL